MTSMPASSIRSALTALSSLSAIWGSASPVRLSPPNILDLMALSDDDQIAELTLPMDWADKTIVELNIRRNFGVSVLGIHRGGKFLTSPGAETMLMAGDVLLVMGKKEAISAVQ